MGQPVNIHIPEPCHESWGDMKATENGRFCGSCSKTVIDFSSMTDKQLFEFFKDYSGNACGRFHNDQLNRNITQAPQRRTGWPRYVMTIMVPAMLLTNRSIAQGRVAKKTAKVCVPAKTPQVEQVPLKGEVVVTKVKEPEVPLVQQQLVGIAGGFYVARPVQKPTVFHQFKNYFSGKSSFNIYPNPAAPGATLKTNFKKGSYIMQVLDMNGLLMQETKLDSQNNSTDISVTLSKNILPGLYTVLLTDDKRKKISSQKLVVQ